MELVRFKDRPEGWDDNIKKFDTKTVFHETSWHDHLLSIHKKSRIEYFSINEKNTIIGFFCCMVVKKFGLKIMGSPLGGTGTNYMGPVVNKDFNQDKLIDSIVRICKKFGIAHLEICNDFLSPHVMSRNEFNIYNDCTHKLKIAETKEEAFNNLKSTCRNRIKKALKNNLSVEVTGSSSIIEHFYEQFKEVYGKQGMAAPFGISRIKSLYNSLYDRRRLLTVWVRNNNEVIATGLFPYDENAIYFWGAASWLKYQKLCPNEILHWNVIKFAVEKNIKEYNMCGGGSQFKNKFGGTDVDYLHYSKSLFPMLNSFRNLFKKWHFLKLRMGGIFVKKKYQQKKRIG